MAAKSDPEFESIAVLFSEREEGVSRGRMMSRPALLLGEKVFAFFSKGDMVFRLGKGFDPALLGARDWEHPAPFKTKPPLFDWYHIPPAHADRWEVFTAEALKRMREGAG